MATSTATISRSLPLIPPPKALPKLPTSLLRPIRKLSKNLGGVSRRNPQIWSIRAVTENVPAPTAPIEATQEIVSTTTAAAAVDGDSVSAVVSSLLLIAFVGLSLLTVGVIYLAVQDFLQKRERDRFEKEEAAKKKKGGKKTVVRAKTGPRGFGQKVEEEEEEDNRT